MITRILLAVDRSRYCRSAAAPVSELASSLGAEVLVVHIQEWPSEVPASPLATSAEASELVQRFKDELEVAGVSALAEVHHARRGQVGAEILHAVHQYGADLIVLGSKGESDARALVLGSIAHRVLQGAPCPVLLVPHLR